MVKPSIKLAVGWDDTGTNSDCEASSAAAHLTVVGKDTLIWNASDRLVDGEIFPDNELRIVRRAPEPATETSSETPVESSGQQAS